MQSKDGRMGGNLRGDSHQAPSGGIKTLNVDTNEQLLVEGGELVLTKGVAASKEKHEFNGEKKTPLQIASELNQNAGGVPLMKNGGFMAAGGEVSSAPHSLYYLNEGNTIADKNSGRRWKITKHKMNAICLEDSSLVSEGSHSELPYQKLIEFMNSGLIYIGEKEYENERDKALLLAEITIIQKGLLLIKEKNKNHNLSSSVSGMEALIH